MLKPPITRLTLAIVIGLCAIATGGALSGVKWTGNSLKPLTGEKFEDDRSAITALLSLPVEERNTELEALAQSSPSPDRNRARYLLALNFIQQKQGEPAIAQLAELEKDYPALGGHILLQRAQAYQLMGDAAQVQATLEQLLENYPDRPVAAEALYWLGKSDPQYAQQALEQFPTHPRSAEIAQSQLEANSFDAPENFPLLRLLAKHLYLPNIAEILEGLTQNYSTQLTPEDWETIAFGYWEKLDYGKAGQAYAQAKRTSRNLYRTGRGLQLGGWPNEAREAYQQLVAEFPEGEETGLGLLRLARLSTNEEASPYLDKIIAQHPDRAAEALIEKSKVLENLNSSKSAIQARQSVLTQYSNSEAAAELRWQTVQGLAKAGKLEEAWQWAQQIVTENPQSEYAPEAAFWVGKWAQRLGRNTEAQQAFEYVLSNYPESYYAWRSASILGWNVGNFNTVRLLSPQVVQPSDRMEPLSGSETLKELYRLGLDRDAWTQWQVEFTNPMQPSVAEQFTDGLMRMGVGDYLDGMFMLSHLAQREKPEEQAQYQALRQQPGYWIALYPFPYRDSVLTWSIEREIDPLLTIALIRQESRFMPSIRSVANAIGLMQVLPETGEWIAQKYGEPKPQDFSDPNDNIRLGTLYLDYTHELYDNNSLFAIASYNAGPGNVEDWIKRFKPTDPDEFVTQIPFPETKGYISSVLGNYWNYLRLYNPGVKQRLEQLNDRK